MIVRTGIIQKKECLTLEEFKKYWLEKHGPLAKEVLKNVLNVLKGYYQNHVTNSDQLGIDFPRGGYHVDGFSQLYFKEGTTIQEMVNEEALKILNEDEAQFIGGLQILITKPNVIVSPNKNRPLIKRMSLLKKKSNIDIHEFKDEWFNVHKEYVLSMPGVKGYIQHLVIDRTTDRKNSASYDEVPIDGIVELWFEDVDSIEKAFRSENGLKTMKHSEVFLEEITTFLVDEYKIL